jgi:hypothetical protein
MPAYHVMDGTKQIWKLRVEDQPSGRPSPWSERATVRTTMPHRPDVALKQERFSAKVSKIMVAQLSVRTAHVHRPDGVRTYHSSRPFEPSAYK